MRCTSEDASPSLVITVEDEDDGMNSLVQVMIDYDDSTVEGANGKLTVSGSYACKFRHCIFRHTTVLYLSFLTS